MATTTLTSSISSGYVKPVSGISLINRFSAWCASKEEKRIFWQGTILTLHACFLTPVSFVAAMLAGVDHYLYIPVIIAIAITVISNLAALPTRITIPVFFLSILIDLGVIIAALFYGLNFSGLF